jgi:FtsP/CotA-like multicopper oxidase with cupredoxin domain
MGFTDRKRRPSACLLAAALLSAPGCSEEPEGDSGSIDIVAGLPEIWGIPVAEDHDPADDVVEVHLEASEWDVEWLEGESTPAWAYNGQIPGPLIQASVGDTLRVVFENNLPNDEATTIHWHGLRIPDYMDGTPMVQDPIEVGETFVYEFVLPDAGSYWYHPHVRSHEQIERGLHGALVVHEEDPVEVVQERYLVLDDVALDTDGDFTSFYYESGPNGVHGRHGNILLLNGSSEPLEGTVRPGGVERWRVVNTANARTMWASVTGASWRVIAVDGPLLEESFTANEVRVPVGRRYDLEVIPDMDAEEVVFNVLLPNEEEGGWYTYEMFTATVEGEPGEGVELDWNPEPIPKITGIEQERLLILNVDTSDGTLNWTINGDVWGEHENIEVDGNIPSEITVKNMSTFEHPFHLHGQFFQVDERNGVDADEPGWRDTVLVEANDSVKLRTMFDNPGRWMAHCHILEHAELGMMTEIIVSE